MVSRNLVLVQQKSVARPTGAAAAHAAAEAATAHAAVEAAAMFVTKIFREPFWWL